MKLDLIAVGILFLFTAGGFCFGAMRSVMKFVSFFGSALISLFLFPLLRKTVVYGLLNEMTERWLLSRSTVLFPKQVASMLSGILLAVILYFGSKILLLLLSSVLEGVTRLPLLKQANRFTGAVLGVAEAGILILGVLALIRIANVTDLELYEWIQQSVFVKMLYDKNPLIVILAGK